MRLSRQQKRNEARLKWSRNANAAKARWLRLQNTEVTCSSPESARGIKENVGRFYPRKKD